MSESYEELSNHAHALFAVAQRQGDAIRQAMDCLEAMESFIDASQARADTHDTTIHVLLGTLSLLLDQTLSVLSGALDKPNEVE